VLCAAPHLLRLFGPTLAPTDGGYVHAAYMLSRGFEPYVQFTQVAFPLAEGVLAGAMRLFGTDLRVVEAVNGLVVLGVALLAYVAGTRLGGRPAGALAALGWSWSQWVVWHNVFARETWAALGVGIALAACFGPRPADDARAEASLPPLRGGRLLLVALGLLLAFAMKITALVAAVGLCAHRLLAGRPREALRLALAVLAGATVMTLLCAWRWGDPFLWQVYLFGWFRVAETDLAARVAHLLGWTDAVLALGLVALFVWALPRLRGPAGAPALVMIAYLLYMLLLSPTIWQHNLINLALPSALLLAGFATARRRRLGATSAAMLALVACIALFSGGYMPGSYGPMGPYFGGWPRDGVANRAAFLERYSGPDEIVATTQPLWAVQAGRIEFVRDHDTMGVALGIEAGLLRDGLAATLRARDDRLLIGGDEAPDAPALARLGPYYGRLMANGRAWVRPLLLDALGRHEIALVMETEGELVPGLLGFEDLQAAGYERVVDHDLGVAGWRPDGGASRPVVRELFRRQL
jgi:hypothetical protein